MSAKAGSSASMIGDALFRMHHGEKIKIGMYIDFFEILDLLFVTIPLIVLYAILWIPYDSKDKVVIRFIIGLVIILALRTNGKPPANPYKWTTKTISGILERVEYFRPYSQLQDQQAIV